MLLEARWGQVGACLALMMLAAGIVVRDFSHLDPRLLDPRFMNVWFDADIPRVFSNMTDRSGSHAATFKHPLFSLLGYGLTRPAILLGFGAQTAVLSALAFNGAVFAAALFMLLRRTGLPVPAASCLTLLAITSWAYRAFFSIPETFAFGATSIVIALLAMTCSGRHSRLALGFGALASLSVTITNFAVGAIAVILTRLQLYRARAAWGPELVRAAVDSAIILGLAGTVALLLAIVQDRLFANAGLFINVKSLVREAQFIGSYVSTPLQRLFTLLVGPMLSGTPSLPQPLSFEPTGYLADGLLADGRFDMTLLSFIGLLSWLALLGTGLVAIYRQRMTVGIAAVLSLLVMLVIHLFYGRSVMLYIAHTLPLVTLVAAMNWHTLGRRAYLLLLPAVIGIAPHAEATLVRTRAQAAVLMDAVEREGDKAAGSMATISML